MARGPGALATAGPRSRSNKKAPKRWLQGRYSARIPNRGQAPRQSNWSRRTPCAPRMAIGLQPRPATSVSSICGESKSSIGNLQFAFRNCVRPPARAAAQLQFGHGTDGRGDARRPNRRFRNQLAGLLRDPGRAERLLPGGGGTLAATAFLTSSWETRSADADPLLQMSVVKELRQNSRHGPIQQLAVRGLVHGSGHTSRLYCSARSFTDSAINFFPRAIHCVGANRPIPRYRPAPMTRGPGMGRGNCTRT